MEKFYIIEKGSPYHGAYLKYKEGRNALLDLFSGIKDKHGIESNLIELTTSSVYIRPTASDLAKFGQVLETTNNQGEYKFHSRSAVPIAWRKLRNVTGVSIKNPPNISNYIYTLGLRYRHVFEYNSVMYCSVRASVFKTDHTYGFTEIKGSHYHLAKEAKEAEMLKSLMTEFSQELVDSGLDSDYYILHKFRTPLEVDGVETDLSIREISKRLMTSNKIIPQ